jgi:pyridoxamine 5'-phosphate oxidase
MVLLKGADANGFVFFSNAESIKGGELAANPNAALNFHWKSLRRAVRVKGTIAQVSDAEADAYFATRAKDSQIGAWASPQSRPMEGRWVFEKAIAEYALKYGLTKVPRPAYWTGWRITPSRIEFWRDKPFRLHDRLVYNRENSASPWITERLFP